VSIFVKKKMLTKYLSIMIKKSFVVKIYKCYLKIYQVCNSTFLNIFINN